MFLRFSLGTIEKERLMPNLTLGSQDPADDPERRLADTSDAWMDCRSALHKGEADPYGVSDALCLCCKPCACGRNILKDFLPAHQVNCAVHHGTQRIV